MNYAADYFIKGDITFAIVVIILFAAVKVRTSRVAGWNRHHRAEEENTRASLPGTTLSDSPNARPQQAHVPADGPV
jgi:hypothetical protein